MFKLHSRFILLSAVMVTCASAPAQTFFSANLTNSSENPPTVPTLSTGGSRPASFGTATFVLNGSQTAMTFTATIFNIDFTGAQTPDPNDDLVAAHIHAGAAVTPTTNAGVVWGFFGAPFNDNNPNDVVITPFTNGVGGTISGKWDLPEGNGTTLTAQLPNLLALRAYINFHTKQFGGGEIRGNFALAPGISTAPILPTGIVGTAYSQTLRTPGGTAPFTWTVSSGTLPAGLTLSNAGVLGGTPTAAGTSTFTITVTDVTSGFSTQTFTLTVLPGALNFTSALRIAHVVDGRPFVTILGIVNLDQAQVSYQAKFWNNDGSALSLPIQGGVAGDVAGTLAPGAIGGWATTGASAQLTQGWAEVASTGKIGVVAILQRFTAAGNVDGEASVIGSQSGSNVLLPFDNSSRHVTGVAVSNSNPTQPLTIFMTFTTSSGSITNATLTLPPHGHTSFVLPTTYPATANDFGTIRFTAPTADISAVSLRFSTDPGNAYSTLGILQ